MSVEYIDQWSDVQIGDEVVTSGLGGVFPAGLTIGKVSEVLPLIGGFKRVLVRPAVPLGRVREVLVLLNKK